MAFLIYTLGLMNVDANSRKILTGFILIIAVLIPNVNKQLVAAIKLKLFYANNKNIEAVNIKAAEEIKNYRDMITAAKKDAKMSESDKAAKVKKYEEKIVSVKAKCKEQTAVLKSELKEDARKAKQRFSN